MMPLAVPAEIVPMWEHQRQAVRMALEHRDFAFLADMGVGKTCMAINTFRAHYTAAGRLMRTLILCPVVVVENWKREFLMHSKINEEQIILCTGSGKYRAKQIEMIAKSKQGAVIVTNFEAMQMADFYKLLLLWRPEIVVVDESQRIKNAKALRTKKIIALGDIASNRYILSGTPILNSGMDIFAQYRFLDGGITFGRNFVEFRNRYFVDLNSGMPAQKHFPNWQPRPGAYEEFNKLIYRKAVRVLKKDCLSLPPLVQKLVPVPMTREQARNYQEMKKDFITYINDSACVAQLALTKALRLLQIASGFFKDTESEDGRSIHYDSTPRIEALREFVDQITSAGQKVIIWACFKENYAAIEKLLGEMKISYCVLYGGMTEKERVASIDAFQKDPATLVMVANQQAGGVGVTLTAASYAIYYSRNFSLEADAQSQARNYRGGSERHDKITRIDLFCPGTIDETVLLALQKKENMAANILAYKEKLIT